MVIKAGTRVVLTAPVLGMPAGTEGTVEDPTTGLIEWDFTPAGAKGPLRAHVNRADYEEV